MKNTINSSMLFLSIAVLFGSITQANDNANQQILKLEAEVAFAEEALSLEDSCGVPIAATIDWTDFPENAFDYSVAGYCEALIDALDHHCSGGEFKRAWIKENVSALSCAYAPKNASVAAVERDSNVITGRYKFDMSNLTDAFKKALLHSL